MPRRRRDWDEWKRALHAVKRRQGGEGFAILLPINEYEHLTQMALSAGATLLDHEGTRGAFRQPEFRQALAFYKSLFDEKLAPIAGATQISNVWNEFARGYFSVYPSGPWTIGDMKSRLAGQLQSSWATAPFPGPTAPGDRRRAGRAWSSMPIGARSGRGVGAGARLVAPAAQAKLQELTGDLPASRAVWAAPGSPPTRSPPPSPPSSIAPRRFPRCPNGSGSSTEMQIVAELFVRGRDEPRRRGGRDGPPRRPPARKAPLDDRAR